LRLSQPFPHEKVAVAGLGVIGQLAARLHAIAGAEVAAADFIPKRVQVAQAAGINAFVPNNTLAAEFQPYFPTGADILVDATGCGDVAAQLIPVGRNHPEDDTTPPIGSRFLVQGGTDGAYTFPHQPAFAKEMSFLLPRDRQPQDVRAVFDLLQRDKLNVSDLISDVRPPETAVTTYHDLQTKPNNYLTIVFQWRAGASPAK
jgi:threonine dehydrogenase-like Zn-dependent dehydrogenase